MPAVTSHGRQIAGLEVADYIDTDLDAFAQTIAAEDYTHIAPQTCGRCTDLIPRRGTQPIERFIEMAGEWRMLNKARALREQMERVGADQALHEAFFYACGFGRFKQHFKAVARSLPYERAKQLGQQEPMLLEAALLQIAGLMPSCRTMADCVACAGTSLMAYAVSP